MRWREREKSINVRELIRTSVGFCFDGQRLLKSMSRTEDSDRLMLMKICWVQVDIL